MVLSTVMNYEYAINSNKMYLTCFKFTAAMSIICYIIYIAITAEVPSVAHCVVFYLNLV